MKLFRSSASPSLFANALLAVLIGGMTVSLPALGAGSGKSGGVTLKGDALAIDATKAPAILRGRLSQPLSFRVMGGWVDKARIERANKLTDEAEKRKEAKGSFGLLTLQVAAGKSEPGTYQLAPSGKSGKDGTVVIQQAKDAGLAEDYTSQSGTLTIQSVSMDASGTAVAAVEGTFDGQFRGKSGENRAFSGHFQFVPKKK